MINKEDAVDLLKTAEHIGVKVWLDGGWGIDALVGYQTRPHNDIDIFIQQKDAAAFTGMLRSKGYREIQMDYTTATHTAWRDGNDRIIDLHLFEFGKEGTLHFENEAYPSEILTGKGIIGTTAVNCLTAEAQLQYHQGYEYDENDKKDVLLLCKTFGFPVPPEYDV
jgi:lincosamide nucleotidyltransferase A/C/D/E